MDLDDLRKKIDSIDTEIVHLLNQRYKTVIDIGGWKKNRSGAVYVPERERAVMERLRSLNHGPMTNETLFAVYREIMSGALSLEHSLQVAYPGPAYGESHFAALLKFGSSVRYTEEASPDAVFADVSSLHADYGCVPVENGEDCCTWELFMKWPDTVICTEVDVHVNRRFLIIGGKKNVSLATGSDQTAVCFTFCGGWNDALSLFKESGCAPSLTACRPYGEGLTLFFVDVPGHKDDSSVRSVLAELKQKSSFMRILGSYPKVKRSNEANVF